MPLWRLLFVFLMLELGGCNTQIYEPQYWHNSFVVGLQKNVGKQYESVRLGATGGWAPDVDFLSRIVLPTGNIAYKYRDQGTCRYTFEVEPKTDIIVAASWEGDERDCAIVP